MSQVNCYKEIVTNWLLQVKVNITCDKLRITMWQVKNYNLQAKITIYKLKLQFTS